MKRQPTQVAGIICAAILATSAWGAEKNPPGDIPDDQVFVSYTSATGGYTVKVPEGWERMEKGQNVGFVDKFGGVAVTIEPSVNPPTLKELIAKLAKTEKAFKFRTSKEIQLPGGRALLIRYESESEINSVTNKSVRLENDAYVFSKDGKMAMLWFWAPLGADNVDQWKMMSESFRW
jgi:hypothetical protein